MGHTTRAKSLGKYKAGKRKTKSSKNSHGNENVNKAMSLKRNKSAEEHSQEVLQTRRERSWIIRR